MMKGQIKFSEDTSFVTETLLKAIAEEDRLVLYKKSERLLRLHAASGIDLFFSAIERYDYYIDLACLQRNQETILKYRIRGNSTYGTLGIVFCLFSIPFLLIALSALDDGSSRYGLLVVFISYLLFLGLILFFIGRRQKGVRDKGMSVFQAVLARVKMSLDIATDRIE